MPQFYCTSCAAKNEYRGVKPKTCKFCDASTDALAGFKPLPTAAPVQARASTTSRPQPTTARRVNRWGSEGNVVMSEEEMTEAEVGDTFESIGLNAQSFAARAEGDEAAPMTVESLRSSSSSFTRPTLSPELRAIQAEALKHMLKDNA